MLAKAEGLDGSIRFTPGNAEALSFDDESFDCIFSTTVLEECDAGRALAEMVRLARLGGRVGVIVRSLDLPLCWSVDVPDEIRRKIVTPPQSVGAEGVADASLYWRARGARRGTLPMNAAFSSWRIPCIARRMQGPRRMSKQSD